MRRLPQGSGVHSLRLNSLLSAAVEQKFLLLSGAFNFCGFQNPVVRSVSLGLLAG